MSDAAYIADAIEDETNIPFGDEVQTDDAALAAFTGEDDGQTGGENTNETPGEPAQENPERGAQAGANAAGFQLQGQTEAEIRAAEEAQLRADAEAQRIQQAAEREAARREQEDRRTRNVNTVASDDFQLGQSREEVARMADTGMVDMFGQPTTSTSQPETSSAQAENVKQEDAQPSEQSKQSALSAITQSDITQADQIKLAANLRKGQDNPDSIAQTDNGVALYSRASSDSQIEVTENEALRGINRLQEAIRRDIGSDSASISKSMSLNQLAGAGGSRSTP